jgi:hypothetical protein
MVVKISMGRLQTKFWSNIDSHISRDGFLSHYDEWTHKKLKLLELNKNVPIAKLNAKCD